MMAGTGSPPLTIRYFCLGSSIPLPRMWSFLDYCAAREDIRFYVHLIGHYPGPPADLATRPYVVQQRHFSAPRKHEVWIVHFWNHVSLMAQALRARGWHVPLLLWGERPGQTWEVRNARDAMTVLLRKTILPILFRSLRRGTILLGTGEAAVRTFTRLSGGGAAREFPYPNPIADACLTGVEPGIRDGTPLFLFAGEITPRKAIDVIIRASERLWETGANFQVCYVCNGVTTDGLQSKLEAHCARSEGRARMRGFAPMADMLEIYQKTHCVLLPSRFDGWGLPVHEALAAGIPAIVSDACGAADLVKRSGSGRVVQAGSVTDLMEGMSWVLNLRATDKERMRDSGLEVARTLTVPRLSDTLVGYCREALLLYGNRGAQKELAPVDERQSSSELDTPVL